MLELTEEQSGYESIRVAFGVWNDVVYALCDSAYQLRAVGEERQCDAMLSDAESMCRRARLHINNMTLRERAKADAELNAVETGTPVQP